MINLDSVLKSRDTTLPAKVPIVKAMIFPVVMYGCENQTIKKAECRARFGSTYTKIGTIQRRLAWPLRKDDTQIREAFHIFDVQNRLLDSGRRGGWNVSREQHRNMYIIQGEIDHQPRLDA